jgi:uncharacterized membrane protein YhaH (DUF805 family)
MSTSNKSKTRLRGDTSVSAPSAFTISNAVLVAVLQVGAIVIGCLAAATSYRVAGQFGGPTSLPTVLLIQYWFCFMGVPLVWITAALRMRRRHDVSVEAKGTIFWFGVFLLVALVVLGLCGFVGPLFGPRTAMDATF